MKRMKKRIFSGCVCEQIVYTAADSTSALRIRRNRFKDEEQYAAFKDAMGRKRFAQLINANFSPESFKGTLTFDAENELYDFADARRIRSAFVRRIRRRCPDAKIIVVMGRGKSTARIHFHYLMDGVTEDVIRGAWTWGEIVECKHLRAHNHYDGVDCGRDYTGLANYYWEHWTREQGGHHYYATRNMDKPEEEKAEETKREYTEAKPPRAPKGYKMVESRTTAFGFLYFKYTKILS